MVFFVPILFILCKLRVIDLKLMLLIIRSNRRYTNTNYTNSACFYQRIYFVVAYICSFLKTTSQVWHLPTILCRIFCSLEARLLLLLFFGTHTTFLTIHLLYSESPANKLITNKNRTLSHFLLFLSSSFEANLRLKRFFSILARDILKLELKTN